MTIVATLDSLPPQPTVLPRDVEVPYDLLLPGVVGDIFAAGVISLVILAHQERDESAWTSIPVIRINELARQHCTLVADGQRGGEMFADNPGVGVEIGVDFLVERGLIEIQRQNCFAIALTRPLIDSLKAFLRC